MLKGKIFASFSVLVSSLCFLVSTGWAVNCACNGKVGALQACINSNPPGSTITVVGPATCYENLTLVQDLDTLTANTTSGKVVLAAANSSMPVISVVGTGVSFISGFTIQGGTFGIDCDLGNAIIFQNTIQNCSVAGINVGGGYATIGTNNPKNAAPSPNTIINCPVGVQVTVHSGAGIVGNTIKSCKTAGIVVDSASQADIAGNTIDGCGNAISVSENSSIRLSDRPYQTFPMWGSLNKTDATLKNTGAAILCSTGGCIRGYAGGLLGSTLISADTTCIQNFKTNSSQLVGSWALVSTNISNAPKKYTFYPDGAGLTDTDSFMWSGTATTLSLTTKIGKTASGALTWGAGYATLKWTITSGTLVPVGSWITMKRQ